MKREGLFWLAAYAFTIPAANYTLAHIGQCSDAGPCLLPVWPGIMAPSGVVWAGISLTIRDFLQESLGRWATVGAIGMGAALSWLISPQFAAASGLAFLLSEFADFAVFTPLKERGYWLGAVLASNSIGLLVDSIAFLALAFGSLDLLSGQVIGKLEVTIATVALLWVWRRGDLPQRRSQAGAHGAD